MIPQANRDSIARVLWGTLGLNVAVAGTKLFVGYSTANYTVIGDGYHSLLDGSNNVLGIVAIAIASRPPDAEHPYGHRKFENAASMAIGGLVFMMGWEILRQVLHTLHQFVSHGTIPEVQHASPLFVALVAGTMVVNFGVSWYEKRAGERLDSSLLKADAAHTASDSIVTAMGLGSLLLARHFWWIDPVLACCVVALLFRVAWTILRDSFDAFTDRSRLDPEVVRGIAEGIGGVENTHAIRSHGFENDVHLDLHIVVSEKLTAAEVCRIEREVTDALEARFPMLTHVAIQHEVEAPDPDAPVWRGDLPRAGKGVS